MSERKVMEGELSSPLTASSGSTAQVSGPSTVACPHCGSDMPATAAFCPACGWSMRPIPVADRALAVLAYLTLIPAATLLLLPRFRRARFLRFHAWQSLLIWGAFLVFTVSALFLSNIAGAMLFLLLGVLASLAMLFLWIVLSVKAWQGERFELPGFRWLARHLD